MNVDATRRPRRPGDVVNGAYREQIRHAEDSIRRNRWLAVTITTVALMVAYGNTDTSQHVFIVFFPLLALQAFAISGYRRLNELAQRRDLISIDIYSERVQTPLLAAAGLSVRETYFLLFLCFDVAWLAKPYIHPTPAVDIAEYLARFETGPTGGTEFLVFTGLFWLVYGALLVISLPTASARRESRTRVADVDLLDDSATQRSPRRVGLTVHVRTFDDRMIRLNAVRMRNKDKQPVILWPGFFQNGHVYDLHPAEGSLAVYLWRKGFDLWIVHSRGTDGSDGARLDSDLDDFASNDIPAVIDFVANKTNRRPVYVGHSQGGITALMSLMGATKKPDGRVVLDDGRAKARQAQLRGLVTLGSFPDFTFSKPAKIQDLVRNGLRVTIFGKKITLCSARFLLRSLSVCRYLPVPISRPLRVAVAVNKYARVIVWPLYALLDLIARLRVWETLYHIPNVSPRAQRLLFSKTIDGTFRGIVTQFERAVRNGRMESLDETVNYSDHYDRLSLPVSFVAMECDSLADTAMMKERLFARVSSTEKFFTEWPGMGHEDCFMNPEYFPQVLEAVRKVC